MSKIRVLSLDPRIGYGVVDYIPETDLYEVVTFGTLNKDKFDLPYKKDAKTFTKTLVYLAVTKEKIKEIMDTFKPDMVSCEDAFNKKFVDTYRILTTWISTVALLLYQNYNQTLYLMAPTSIKKYCTGDGHADKDVMKKALMERKDVSFNKDLNLEDLTEHAIDAISGAITYVDISTGKKK